MKNLASTCKIVATGLTCLFLGTGTVLPAYGRAACIVFLALLCLEAVAR